jgi:hypothetical protein
MRTRHWGFGATVLAAAVLALVALPPRPIAEEYSFVASLLGLSYRTWNPEGASYSMLVHRVRDRYREAIAARAHGAADVRESRGPLALRSAREPLVVVRDPDVPIGIATEWLREAERELSLFPRAASGGVPVIIGLHTRSFASAFGYPSRLIMGARMLYTEGRDTACIADIRLPGRDTALIPAFYWHVRSDWGESRVMGRCALYARYGIPGPGVRAWYGLATQWEWTDDGSLRLYMARRDIRRQQLERTSEWGNRVPAEYLMCLDNGVACEGIFGLRVVRDRDQWYYRRNEASLIAGLLTSGGPERFTAFWRSELPVDSALQRAYGASVGSVGRTVLLRRFIPPEPSGPHRGAAGTSVVWLAGLLGLAMVLSRRQTMGL